MTHLDVQRDEGAPAAASPVAARPSDRDDPTIEELVRARRRRARRTSVLVRVAQVGVFAALLGLWELVSGAGWLDNADIFYGKPSDIAKFLVDERSVLWDNTETTLYAMFLGFAIGSAAAIAFGLFLGRFRLVDRILDPLLTVLASLPRIALVPLFLLWFGITLQAKLAISISSVFFVVLYNTRAGVKSADVDLQIVAKLLGARHGALFSKVILPGAVPVIFAGLRLGMIYAMLGTIASEMVSAESGLGVQIVRYGQTLEPNGVFAVLVILAFASSLFSGVLKTIESRLLRWMPEDRRS
jgi:NitT/TauT family transport system permease protein